MKNHWNSTLHRQKLASAEGDDDAIKAQLATLVDKASSAAGSAGGGSGKHAAGGGGGGGSGSKRESRRDQQQQHAGSGSGNHNNGNGNVNSMSNGIGGASGMHHQQSLPSSSNVSVARLWQDLAAQRPGNMPVSPLAALAAGFQIPFVSSHPDPQCVLWGREGGCICVCVCV